MQVMVFTASYAGFVNGDDATVLTTQPTFSCEATAESPAGTYTINVSGIKGFDGLYDFSDRLQHGYVPAWYDAVQQVLHRGEHRQGNRQDHLRITS